MRRWAPWTCTLVTIGAQARILTLGNSWRSNCRADAAALQPPRRLHQASNARRTAPDPPDGKWIDATGATHLAGGEAALLADLVDRLYLHLVHRLLLIVR